MDHEPTFNDQFCERIAKLAPSPVTARLLQAVRNDKAPVRSLADAVAADPLVADRLLRVANFAPGLTQRLLGVSEAIETLGAETVKALALGLTTFPLPSGPDETPESGEDDGPVTLCQLWEHSLGCATLAGRLAPEVEHVVPLQAFVAGLLHDVGRVLIYRCARDQFIEAYTIALDKRIPLSEAETLALGMNHLTLGEIWTGRGDLSHSLQQIVRYHEESQALLPETLDAATRGAIAVVQLADRLCESRGIGSGGDAPANESELWEPINICEEAWADQFQAVKRQIEAARQFFGFAQNAGERVVAYRRSKPKARLVVSSGERVAANSGRGSVIPFPVRRENADEGGEKPAPRKLTVLVVEDHSSLCDLLSLYLMRHGYHVRMANNGETALELLAKEEIHLVLLDLMLPRLDGFAVLRKIRESHKGRVPYIIVVSAGASERDRNKVLELGANEYMPKPFHLVRLLERIQTVEKYLL